MGTAIFLVSVNITKFIPKSKKKVTSLAAKTSVKDLAFMAKLLEDGKVVPVIDRKYPLSETAEAVRYYGERHARGKVVITVEHD